MNLDLIITVVAVIARIIMEAIVLYAAIKIIRSDKL